MTIRPKRRWQFGVRWIFLGMALVSAYLAGWTSNEYRHTAPAPALPRATAEDLEEEEFTEFIQMGSYLVDSDLDQSDFSE